MLVEEYLAAFSTQIKVGKVKILPSLQRRIRSDLHSYFSVHPHIGIIDRLDFTDNLPGRFSAFV